jgi:hypothetical protein
MPAGTGQIRALTQPNLDWLEWYLASADAIDLQHEPYRSRCGLLFPETEWLKRHTLAGGQPAVGRHGGFELDRPRLVCRKHIFLCHSERSEESHSSGNPIDYNRREIPHCVRNDNPR